MGGPVILVKVHPPGKPLSEAEHQQRRAAARVRWAKLGAGAVVGGLAGAGIARAAHLEAAYREAGTRTAARLAEATEAEIAEGARAEMVVREAHRIRRGGVPLQAPRARMQEVLAAARRVRTPATAMQTAMAEETHRLAQGLPARTREEIQARADEIVRTFHAHGGTEIRSPFPPVPPIGTIQRPTQIYDYQINRAQRRLLPERAHLARLIRAGKASGDEAAEDAPEARATRVRIASIEKEIADLETLKAHAPKPIVRAGGTRRQAIRVKGLPRGTRLNRPVRAGKKLQDPDLAGLFGIEMDPTVSEQPADKPTIRVRHAKERKFVGGETLKQVGRRIAGERQALGVQEARTLGNLESRIQIGIRQARARIEQQSIDALHQALASGEIHSRILRATGRGGALGAGIGLTATGLGLLAHHAATSGRRRPEQKAEKLAKLARRDSPEDRMAMGLAATWRRWIDRLLGHNQESMHLGDGIAEALTPGLTQAYAAGAQNPPIQQPDDPGWHIDVDFDQLDPATRRHMAAYALDRIVDITDAQREAIRQALMPATTQGIGPVDVARTVRASIGLTPYQQSVVASFRGMLETLDPRVFDRQLRDKRYDKTVRYAIANGEPLNDQQVDQMTDAYHRRFLALRARTIARTEALRATSYAAMARTQQVLDRHPSVDVTKRWLATHDERTRPTHVELDGKEVDGLMTPFVTEKGNRILWPLDEHAAADETINCRCTLQYILKPKSQLGVAA